MSVRRIALLGGGGHASDLLAIFEAIGGFTDQFEILVGDDQWNNRERFVGRCARLLSIDEALSYEAEFIGATGYPESRRALVKRAQTLGRAAATALVHPTTEVSTGVSIGPGSVAQGLSWLSPLVAVGQHSYIGYGAKIGHDTSIGDFCSLMPNCFVGGDVSIGDGVLIGAGAIVLQGLSVGSDATIGAGSVVTSHVAPNTTVLGCPARVVSGLST